MNDDPRGQRCREQELVFDQIEMLEGNTWGCVIRNTVTPNWILSYTCKATTNLNFDLERTY
jgi:hypothetical protein